MNDILSSIDEVIDATTGRCAHCGGRLPADCPSDDWCSQDCQRAWTAAYGDPLIGVGYDDMTGQETSMRWTPEVEEDGYRDLPTRVDAVDDVALARLWALGTSSVVVSPGVNGAGPAISVVDEPRPGPMSVLLESSPPLIRRAAPEPPEGEGRAIWGEGWYMATSGPVTFRRWCDHCREYRRPIDGVRAPALTAADFVRADDLTAVTLPELRRCDLCSHCRTPWPAPRFVAQWRQPPQRFWYNLRLSACDREVIQTLDIEFARYQRDVVDYAWGQMVAELLDSLTYRAPCMVDGCSVKARSFFTVRRPIEFLGRSWPAGDLDLCPRHESELWSTTRYPYSILIDPTLLRPAARREQSA